MKVQQLMTKDVATCRPDDGLSSVAQAMWERDCGCMPVCADGETKRLVGIITDRDVCMHAHFRGEPLRELRVDGAMTRDVRTCSANDTLEVAERIMREAQVRRLPVVNGNDELVGVISLADLAEEAACERTMAKHEITEEEVGDTLSAICVARMQQAAA